MKLRYKNIFGYAALAIMLSVFIASQLYFALQENQTIDEGVHISAGYSYLKTVDFRMNPEHPPLLKMFAALPLLIVQPHLPTTSNSWIWGNQWLFAKEFLYYSGNATDTLLFLGRLPIILLSLLIGVLIARWSFRIAGWPGAFFSMGWFVTSPVLLAHGHLITTDVPVAFGFLLSAYCFRNFIFKGSKRWFFLTILAVAVSVNIKFSALLLFVLLPGLYLFFFFYKKNQFPHLKIRTFFVFLLSIIFGSLLLSFILTGGNSTIMKDDSFGGIQRITETTELAKHSSGIKAVVLKGFFLIAYHAPIPAYPYLNGLLKFLGHNANGHDSFFMGTFSDEGSPWYFPVAFLIKTPVAFIITLSLLFALFVKQNVNFFRREKHLSNGHRIFSGWLSSFSVDTVILLSIPIVYMLFSMTSHINIGVRHIAPIYPFLFIAVSYLLIVVGRYKKVFIFLLTAILIFGSTSVIFALPFPLSYYSEIIGGTKNGHLYMMDSNLDWGQNLKYVKRYMNKNNIQNICIAYFGQGNYEHEKITVQSIPKNWQIEARANINCVAVISGEILFGKETDFSWMQNFRHTTMIGGMYIFDFRK